MTAIEQKVIKVEEDGTPIIEAFILSNSTPSTFPKDGTDIIGMESYQKLAPFSIVYVVDEKSLYVANEDVDFIKQ